MAQCSQTVKPLISTLILQKGCTIVVYSLFLEKIRIFPDCLANLRCFSFCLIHYGTSLQRPVSYLYHVISSREREFCITFSIDLL